MEDGDGGFDRPELRAPGGGLALHQDRRTFLIKVQELRTDCLRDLQERALSDVDRDDALASWSKRWNLVDDWLVEVARKTYGIYAQPETHRGRRDNWRKIYRFNREQIEAGEMSVSPPPDEDDSEPPFVRIRWYGLGHTQFGMTREDAQENPFVRAPVQTTWPPDPEIDAELEVTVPDWPPDPEIDSEAEARAAFERYWNELLQRSRERGASEATEKRAHTGGSPDLHFAWLVRWQVGPDDVNESHQKIADDPGEGVRPRSRQTVQEAVARTADRIELTRRSQL